MLSLSFADLVSMLSSSLLRLLTVPAKRAESALRMFVSVSLLMIVLMSLLVLLRQKWL